MDDLTFTMSIPVLIAIVGLIWKVWKQGNDITRMSVKYAGNQRKAEDRILVLETEHKAHNKQYDDLNESIGKIFDKLDMLASEIRNERQ